MADYSRFQNILVQRSGGVATLTLNRPDRLNAVNAEMRGEIQDVFGQVARDPDINILVLTGAGRAFCAGGDIGEMSSGQIWVHNDLMHVDRIAAIMLDVPQPIIGAINGDAVGLGATMALLCDVTFVADTARIGDPHVKVGLVAGDGGALVWPLLVGPSRAKEYLMTGDLVPAVEAERMGLINHAVPAAEVQSRAMAYAQKLAEGPTLAVRWTKLAVNKHVRHVANLVLELSMATELLTAKSEDHKEASQAFLEKRKPRYKGR